MRVPLSWLSELARLDVDPDDGAAVRELAATFADLGLVPESVERAPAELEGVVVARVAEIAAIPGADRIRRVLVDAGEEVQVVCGAWNFAEGDVVALARPGALLPGAGGPLQRRRMRGVASEGMLCSPAELGLGEDGAGILVLGGEGLEPGRPFAEAMGAQADVVFDLEVQANRPDCLSVAGVARDVAARLGARFSLEELDLWPERRLVEGRPGEVLGEGGVSVAVEAPDLCGRLRVDVLEVRVGSSPLRVARRLRLAGMRPINSVVDASNYVMLELGQPTHPYDLDRLGAPGLLVRRAAAGERLVTLDGVERALGKGGDDCVIADAKGTAVGIAGVMGGESSEIGPATTAVLLETAWFDPIAIGATARRLGLRTGASARFEKGCDPQGIGRAAARMCALLERSGSLRSAAVPMELRREEVPPPPVRLRLGRLNGLLGTSLRAPEVEALLAPMGFATSVTGGEVLSVEVPSWRPDTSREVDVIEEVARQHGYGRIPPRQRRPTQVGRLTPYQSQRRLVRSLLCGLGASEAWTPTLLAPGDHERAGLVGATLEVANPMAAEESVLRASLLPGLLGAVAYNQSRRETEVALFEVGRTFSPPQGGRVLPEEVERVAVVLARAGDGAAAAVRAWRVLAEGLRLATVQVRASAVPGLHRGRGAALVDSAGVELGVLGEVEPGAAEAFGLPGRRIGWLEADLGLLSASPRRPEEVTAPSRYPSADFDLAFTVSDKTPAADVESTLSAAAGDLLVSIALFDVFRESQGSGRRSLAWRLRLASADHTLSERELADARERCVRAVESAHPAMLRG